MASAMDAGDPFTHGRAYRCSKYARGVGAHFELAEAELLDLELAALLQDLGKKLALYETSRKPGPLTPDERIRMATHAGITAQLLSEVPFLRLAAEMIASLNERWNGNGVPLGLRGDRIPLGSRILAITSAFDALTSDRPYRRGLTPSEAYAEMRREADTRFDPEIIEAFISLHESGALFSGFDRKDALLYLSDAAFPPGFDPATDSGSIGLRRSA
jgi:HD-GYP domain-containing protein (c-di-GMP phosphodiesterase class II)